MRRILERSMRKLGWITKAESDQRVIDAAQTALMRADNLKPGDELIDASRSMRKFGFRIVYALGDDKVEERALRLGESLAQCGLVIPPEEIIQYILPNIREFHAPELLQA